MENIVYVTGNVIKGVIQPLHVNINLTIGGRLEQKVIEGMREAR